MEQSTISKSGVRLFLILFIYILCTSLLVFGSYRVAKDLSVAVPDFFTWNIHKIQISTPDISLNWIKQGSTEISAWFNKAFIFIENQYQSRFGFYSENFLINLVKTNYPIFRWIALGASLLLAYFFIDGNLDVSFKYRSKLLVITSVFLGILFFLLLLVYYSSILNGGAWERQTPYYWNWQLGITAFSCIILIFVAGESTSESPATVSWMKFCSLLSQIFILIYFMEAIFFLGQSTTSIVEIQSNRGWQSGNITMGSGQEAKISCNEGLWTINKNDLQNNPQSSAGGSPHSNTVRNPSLPHPNAFLGSLLARVGTDPKVYIIGRDATFTSRANGYIYLRINDVDDALWDNEGSVKCQVEIIRSQIALPLSLDNLITIIKKLFIVEPILSTIDTATPVANIDNQNGFQPNIVETPTLMPTKTIIPLPTKTLKPTSTPRPTFTVTPTIEVPIYLNDYLIDPIIVQNNVFTESNYKWSFSSSHITFSNGVANLEGVTSWSNFLNLNVPLNEGEGFVIDYLYAPSSNCEIYIANGEWYTDNYKRFGIYPLFSSVISSKSPGTNYWNGKDSTLNPLGMSTQPNTWYTLFIGVDSGGKFLAVIWEKDHRANNIKYAQSPGSKWSGLSWSLGISADRGSISLNNFSKVSFKHFK